MMILICISTYVHLAKSSDPGQAPQLRYDVGPGYALFAFLRSRNGILRTVKTGPTLYVGRQTMVFTECKLKFFPIILPIYKTKQAQTRLRMVQHLDCV